MKREYGIQMYSLRDSAPKDLEGALRAVSEMGYRYVEFAGFFGTPAETVKGWLDKYGLIPASTHTEGDALRPEVIDETIAYHKAIGCDTIVIPGYGTETEEALDRFIDIVNYAIPKIRAAGMRLGYHNHSHEFIKKPYGKFVEEELYRRTDILFEIDTFWAYNAGLDPIKLMSDMGERLLFIHIKDGYTSPDAHKAIPKALGEGEAPVDAVRTYADEHEILAIVESEGCDPTGALEAKRCIEYLNK